MVVKLQHVMTGHAPAWPRQAGSFFAAGLLATQGSPVFKFGYFLGDIRLEKISLGYRIWLQVTPHFYL
jgi:hypothetical protein